MNLPVIGIRETHSTWENEEVMGIRMSRFCASWLVSGGSYRDQDGFLVWMMNIPFKDKNGLTVYISQDDAEDAYRMMSCGKCELEVTARKFLRDHEQDESGYCIIPELEC